MIDEIEPRCPNCDYDLRGLPIPHNCPECGTFVDVVQTVWRSSLAAMLFADRATRGTVISLGLMVAIVPIAVAGRTVAGGMIALSIALVLFLLGSLLAFLCRKNRVAFGPDGLNIQRPFSVQLIAWDRVSHFQKSTGNGELWEIRLKSPPECFELPPVLLDEIAVRDFHRSLALAKARWGTRSTAVVEPPQSRIRSMPQKWGDMSGPLRDPRYSGVCPWCAFELTGHPAKSICPGCGAPYSPELRVWRPSHLLATIGAIVGVTFLVATAVMTIAMFRQDRIFSVSGFLVPALIFVANLVTVIWLESRYRDNGVVFIDEEGVEVRRHGKKICRFRNEQLVGIQRERKNVVISTEDGAVRVDQFFANEDAAKEFVVRVEKLIAAIAAPPVAHRYTNAPRNSPRREVPRGSKTRN